MLRIRIERPRTTPLAAAAERREPDAWSLEEVLAALAKAKKAKR